MLQMNLKLNQLGSDHLSTNRKFELDSTPADNNENNIRGLQFDNRLIGILTVLRNIHQIKNHSDDFALNYLVDLFENEVSEKGKTSLIKEIKRIGYDKLKATFEEINMECESYLCETENLFGILKRYQFNKQTPDSDREKLKQIIQFLHVTLIHINILHKSETGPLPGKIIAMKNLAFETLEPFVNKVGEILDDLFHRIIFNEKIHSNGNNYINDNY
jgi:hypothetical protein